MKCAADSKMQGRFLRRARDEALEFYGVLFCYTLAEKYNFGKPKLLQVLASVGKLVEELDEGTKFLTFDDMKKLLKDEYDLIVMEGVRQDVD